jgi:hypothetical protein
VALDDASTTRRTAQPAEGSVVDSDVDLVALCSRMQASDSKHCAILFCEERGFLGRRAASVVASARHPPPPPPRAYH